MSNPNEIAKFAVDVLLRRAAHMGWVVNSVCAERATFTQSSATDVAGIVLASDRSMVTFGRGLVEAAVVVAADPVFGLSFSYPEADEFSDEVMEHQEDLIQYIRDEGLDMARYSYDPYSLADAQIVKHPLGVFSEGIDGSDVFYLVERKDGDLTPDQARTWLLPQVYVEGRDTPGGRYCHTVRAMAVEHSTSKVVCIVEQRFDV